MIEGLRVSTRVLDVIDNLRVSGGGGGAGANPDGLGGFSATLTADLREKERERERESQQLLTRGRSIRTGPVTPRVFLLALVEP